VIVKSSNTNEESECEDDIVVWGNYRISFPEQAVFTQFKTHFAWCIDTKDDVSYLSYDNLINVCMMVKDGGPGLRDVLEQNLPYIDRWTVLDTGSTDGTQDLIQSIWGHLPGTLYEEPFINFRDSRNRLLDLAGDVCHFVVMLDDSYVLQGPLRAFLDFARGDDVADSFSLTIEDPDTLYASNRITKPSRGLRYTNLMHEIIQKEGNHYNVQIKYANGHLEDMVSEYHSGRTNARKANDIQVLLDMYEENPESRTLYYIADSYIGMKEWDKALYYFKLRVTHPGEGFEKELQDALYYIAVISHFFLDETLPWGVCHQLFLDAYAADPARGDTLYFIGLHYAERGELQLAYMYLKQAFRLGMPPIYMSVRKNIYTYHIPKALMHLCFAERDYDTGAACAERVLDACATQKEVPEAQRLYPENAATWLGLFCLMRESIEKYPQSGPSPTETVNSVKTVYVVAPGAQQDAIFALQYARCCSNAGAEVTVFCEWCESRTLYNGVQCVPLHRFLECIYTNVVDVVVVSHRVEYLSVSYRSRLVRGAVVLLDDVAEGMLLPIDGAKLYRVVLRSESLRAQFSSLFPQLRERARVLVGVATVAH